MSVTSNEVRTTTDEELAALSNNISAVLAVTASVEKTLGPKGLDTMLVDRFGDVLVTNSGVTILERMEISHPAARMLLNVAKTQHSQIGDGTTTATVMASAILKEGLNQISRGVPVSRLLEGIQLATELAIKVIKEKITLPVLDLSDPSLLQVAHIASRGDLETAELVSKAAKTIGEERMSSPSYKLSDIILAKEGTESQLIEGVVLSKSRLSFLNPSTLSGANILVLDDSLRPDEVEDDALRTELGFKKSLELKNQFFENLQKILSLGVNAIFVEGGIDEDAAELLSHSGVFVVRRLTTKELQELVLHTGAKPIKRGGLNREPTLLQKNLGHASYIHENEKDGLILISGGKGEPRATLLVGAQTRHVLEEKERKTQDAAAALQAAYIGGIVPGGGSTELATASLLESKRSEFKSMTSYGLDCVIEGLKKPFIQMAVNAGFNPLEKAEEILMAQLNQRKYSFSINYETGLMADMQVEKVYDPALVKIHALKSSSEVAQAILRINRVIKMRENKPPQHAT